MVDEVVSSPVDPPKGNGLGPKKNLFSEASFVLASPVGQVLILLRGSSNRAFCVSLTSQLAEMVQLSKIHGRVGCVKWAAVLVTGSGL